VEQTLLRACSLPDFHEESDISSHYYCARDPTPSLGSFESLATSSQNFTTVAGFAEVDSNPHLGSSILCVLQPLSLVLNKTLSLLAASW
jgi:hypothetical protein